MAERPIAGDLKSPVGERYHRRFESYTTRHLGGKYVIASFSGEYAFLSNFYPVKITYEGDVYPSVEHAYQAAKTLDLASRERIRLCITPGKAKRLGGNVEVREDWLSLRVTIMRRLVHSKFEQPFLRRMLVATGGHQLIEGNGWGDTFWGVCNGVGENNLGKILMGVRDELRL